MAETTITSALPCMLSSDSRTNGNGGTSLTISPIERLTASLHSKRQRQVGIAGRRDLGLERRVGKPGLAGRSSGAGPSSAGSRGRRRNTSGRSASRSIVKTRPGKSVGSPPLRIEIEKLGRLAHILGDRRQPVILDDVRYEAFFMLDLHRVEGAAVAVDADEEVAAT